MCVLELAKRFFFSFVPLAFVLLLLFVLATVHVTNALESNTVYSPQVFLCRGLVYELQERREGGGGVGEGE